jgi:hypothetical protein
LKNLRAFIRKDPYGLYRGEAYLLMGHTALQKYLDVAGANKSFFRVFTWMQRIQQRDGYLDKFSLGDRVVEKTRPPASEYGKNAFGFHKRSNVRPGQLVNRKTCPWYLRWLRKEALLGSGFRFVLERDSQGARDHFGQLRELDEEIAFLEAHEGPNTITRLVGAADVGFINCYKHEMAGLSRRGRIAALLGDYWYAALRRDVARRVYRNLAEGKYAGTNLYDTAYGAFGLGSCAYFERNYVTAAEHFARFEEEFARSPLAAYGLFSLGQSLYMPFNYTKKKDAELRKKWEAAFQKAARVGVHSFWAEYSRFRLGMIYALSARHREKGRRILSQVAARCRDSRSKRTRSLSELATVLIEDSRAGDTVYAIE